ncbi:hypothetical protein SynBIOSE41_03715 [Synechococcus sp. BIOS-E4-1]|nr:hypothetical protein SynBIOSE41_03715 [Synechococcus sp. BIOS-E4-1]
MSQYKKHALCDADDWFRRMLFRLSGFMISAHTSEVRLNSKACRLFRNISSAKSMGWNYAGVTIDLTEIFSPRTSVVTSFMTHFSTELPQLMPFLMLVASGFRSGCHCPSCGSNQPGAKNRFGCFVCAVQRRHGFKAVNDGGGSPLDFFKITVLLMKPARSLWCEPNEVLVRFSGTSQIVWSALDQVLRKWTISMFRGNNQHCRWGGDWLELECSSLLFGDDQCRE